MRDRHGILLRFLNFYAIKISFLGIFFKLKDLKFSRQKSTLGSFCQIFVLEKNLNFHAKNQLLHFWSIFIFKKKIIFYAKNPFFDFLSYFS